MINKIDRFLDNVITVILCMYGAALWITVMLFMGVVFGGEIAQITFITEMVLFSIMVWFVRSNCGER